MLFLITYFIKSSVCWVYRRLGRGRVACLSWKPEHTRSFVVAANPIYLILGLNAHAGSSIEFEILESDAELLMAHAGTKHVF